MASRRSSLCASFGVNHLRFRIRSFLGEIQGTTLAIEGTLRAAGAPHLTTAPSLLRELTTTGPMQLAQELEAHAMTPGFDDLLAEVDAALEARPGLARMLLGTDAM